MKITMKRITTKRITTKRMAVNCEMLGAWTWISNEGMYVVHGRHCVD